MKQNINWTQLIVIFFTTLLCRFMPHEWGWTPAVALSMVSTYFFGIRAMIPILLGQLCSDMYLGFYDASAMIGTYAGYAVSSVAGYFANKKKDAIVMLSAGVGANAAFFGLSNFGVWLTQYYEHTWQGLANCYIAAVPFWRGQFTADIMLTLLTVLAVFYKPSPARALARRRNAGFTLIELLVVIAIISILAAILFPVFSQAKGAAKKTQSIAYVKQLNLASLMYSGDNDGVLMRDHINGNGKTYYWWGSWDGTTLVPQESYLYPYTKSKEINQDSMLPNTFRTSLGLTGYGYNYAYLSPTNFDANWNEIPVSVSDTSAESPSETIAFATAARINNWSFSPYKLEGSALIDPPSYEFPGVHARHVGEKAVLAWLDGHAGALSVTYRTQPFGYGNQPEWYKQSQLGDVMKQGCNFESECQDYYYDLN